MAIDKQDGFQDNPQSGFASEAEFDVYQAVYRLVMAAYGYRCAFTGQLFSPDLGIVHPHLETVPIQPREQGGGLRISNYLCLRHDAADAFVRGWIIVASDYALIADRTLLSRSLADALLDRPHLPADAVFQPDSAALRFHREWALRR